MKSALFPRKQPNPELEHLYEELSAVQGDLQQAWQQFNLAVDPELVEACVYQVNAVRARRNYLIRLIRHYTPDTVSNRITEPSEVEAAWI